MPVTSEQPPQGVIQLSSQNILERCRAHEGGGLRSAEQADPFVLERAEGAFLYDGAGDRYLDLSGLYAVANIGHGHPEVVAAVRRQAGELMHCPSAYPSRVRAEFYEALDSIAPPGLSAMLPAMTGAMANEMAVAIARTRRPGGQIISFAGSYFGRSAGVVGMAGKTKFRSALGVPANAQFLPYPYPLRMGADCGEVVLSVLDALAGPAGGVGEVAAVVVEAIQGNGGVVIPPADFLPGLRDFCDRTGALLIIDEIQAGFGRSGRTWSIEHVDVLPDLMTVGKGIGGGMAVAAILGRREFMTWPADSYSSTFLTNQVNLAAAVAAIRVFRESDLAERSRLLGVRALKRLRQELSGLPRIAEIRGLGLWVGIELHDNVDAGKVLAALRRHRIIAGGGGYEGNVVKVQPPLVIDEADLSEALDTMIQVVGDVAGSEG